MSFKKYLLVATCAIAMAGANAIASEDQDDRLIKKCNKLLKRAKTNLEQADILVNLKRQLSFPVEETAELSKGAIAIYKGEHKRLFDQLSTNGSANEKIILNMANLYKKIADVHLLDGVYNKADKYYLLSARFVVHSINERTGKNVREEAAKLVSDILDCTSLYCFDIVPLLTWASDLFAKKDLDMANSVFDLVLCTDVEYANLGDVLNASYRSFIADDKEFAFLYFNYAQDMLKNKDPMMDRSCSLYERFANMIAMDVINILLSGSDINENKRVLIPKWGNAIISNRSKLHKHFKTIFGLIGVDDLEDGEKLYDKIYSRHLANL